MAEQDGIVLRIAKIRKKLGFSLDSQRQIDIDDLVIRRGEVTVLLGPSGSGKTTLLCVLSGLLDASDKKSDDWHYHPESTSGGSPSRREARSHFGFVLQGNDLFRDASARTNIMATTQAKGLPVGAEWQTRTGDILKAFGFEKLTGDHLEREVWTFSGGERQVIATARELSSMPEILFADEPGSNLDQDRRQALVKALCSTMISQGKTVVMVTHDPTIAGSFGDRFLVLNDEGRLALSLRREGLLDEDIGCISRTAGFAVGPFRNALQDRSGDTVVVAPQSGKGVELRGRRSRWKLARRIGTELAVQPLGSAQAGKYLCWTRKLRIPRASGIGFLSMMVVMTLAIYLCGLAYFEVDHRFRTTMREPEVRHTVVFRRLSENGVAQPIRGDIVRELDQAPWITPEEHIVAGSLDSTDPCKNLTTAFPFNVVPDAALSIEKLDGFSSTVEKTQMPRQGVLLVGCEKDSMIEKALAVGTTVLGERADAAAPYNHTLFVNAQRETLFDVPAMAKAQDIVLEPGLDSAYYSLKLSSDLKSIELLRNLPGPTWEEVSFFLPMQAYSFKIGNVEESFEGVRVFFDPDQREDVRRHLESRYVANMSNFRLLDEMSRRMQNLQHGVAALFFVVGAFGLAIIFTSAVFLINGNSKPQLLMTLRGFSPKWVLASYFVMLTIHWLFAALITAVCVCFLLWGFGDSRLWSPEILPINFPDDWSFAVSHGALVFLASLVPFFATLLMIGVVLLLRSPSNFGERLRQET